MTKQLETVLEAIDSLSNDDNSVYWIIIPQKHKKATITNFIANYNKNIEPTTVWVTQDSNSTIIFFLCWRNNDTWREKISTEGNCVNYFFAHQQMILMT